MSDIATSERARPRETATVPPHSPTTRGKAIPFDGCSPETLSGIELSALQPDRTLSIVIVDFLGLTGDQKLNLDATLKDAFKKAEAFAARNLHVVEETQTTAKFVIGADPNGETMESRLKERVGQIVGDERKADFLWTRMSNRFLSDLADFGQNQRVVQITALPEKDNYGYPLYSFESWNVKKDLFEDADELLKSGRVSDPGIASFRYTYRSPEVPPFMRPFVKAGK